MRPIRTRASWHAATATALALLGTVLSYATALAGTGPGPWPK
ncbi:hypothetical protein BH23CHL6_BH23CHL6_01260 [soil metagenome]|jgi:hypothetical protein